MTEIINKLIVILRQGIPCLFQVITGLYCPGCGGTRALIYLMRGQIVKSFRYHPLVPYMAAVVLIEVISYGASKLFRNPRLHIRHYDLFVYIGIGIILVNWFWKNYMLLARGINLLSETLGSSASLMVFL